MKATRGLSGHSACRHSGLAPGSNQNGSPVHVVSADEQLSVLAHRSRRMILEALREPQPPARSSGLGTPGRDDDARLGMPVTATGRRYVLPGVRARRAGLCVRLWSGTPAALATRPLESAWRVVC